MHMLMDVPTVQTVSSINQLGAPTGHSVYLYSSKCVFNQSAGYSYSSSKCVFNQSVAPIVLQSVYMYSSNSKVCI